MSAPRILYCNCTYAQVVPKECKDAFLKKLCESGVAFEAVADLCEMSARKDPALKRLADGDVIKIAACYPRAVKWLFAAANAALPADRTEILNMRVQNAEEVATALFDPNLKPNLPARKATPSLAASRWPRRIVSRRSQCFSNAASLSRGPAARVKSRPPTAVRFWFWAGSTKPNRHKPKTPPDRSAYAFKTSPGSTPIALWQRLIL